MRSRLVTITWAGAVLAVIAAWGTAGLHAHSTATDQPGAAADSDGKAVFLAQKCSLCHSVDLAGIQRTTKSSKAPDLSKVGSEREASWIEKWLKKEELLNGKKHQKSFTGTDEELAVLVKWLADLKASSK